MYMTVAPMEQRSRWFSWPMAAAVCASVLASGPVWSDGLTEIPADESRLLTDPYLQKPGEDSVHVVWMSNFPGIRHELIYGEGRARQRARAQTQKMERLLEDADSRVRGRSFDEVVRRPVYRHEAIASGLTPGERVPYRVRSVSAEGKVFISDAFTLQPTPPEGQAMKILLTSDLQNRQMTPANFQKVEEEVGKVDAVFLSADLVDIPRRASEWFDRFDENWLSNPGNPGGRAFPAARPPFFPALQGRYQEMFPEFPYRGGQILQHAPLFPALGNHEVSGRFRPNETFEFNGSSRTAGLNSMFGDPQPRWFAERQYELVKATVNPDDDPAVKEQWIRDNSHDFKVYRDMWTLPEGPQGESYYATKFGDVFLVAMNVSRIWRTWNVNPGDRSKFIEALAESNNPAEWGFGEFLFERFDENSEQYRWLVETLASEAAQSAKYRVVLAHQGVFGLGDNAVPVLGDPVMDLVYIDGSGVEQTRRVTLPDDPQARRTVFENEVAPLLGSLTEVRYEYPLDQDLWRSAIEPVLMANDVQLVHIGHSHLWNRARVGNLNYLESSNVGNTFGAYWRQPDGTNWRGRIRAIWASSFWNELASGDSRWDPAYYPPVDDPHGRDPIFPTLANPMVLFEGEPADVPFVSSNNVTVFSILDTGMGAVRSYAFDTRDPDSQVIEFDRFSLQPGE